MNIATLITALERKGYAVFKDDSKNYNLNLVGVRTDNDEVNKFDDMLYCFWNHGGKWHLLEYQITTDPGKYWLEQPMNAAGTAILVPGQYRGAWKLGSHQNKYQALCQAKPVKVYRDNDKDNELDFDPETIDEGMFGINIHRSNPYGESYTVDKWSAGCQVFKDIKSFNDFMNIVDKAILNWGNSFTYTLLNENDL